MKSDSLRLLIIGGVAAGASAAARARRLSESARITIIERGPDVSFANCGLPYHIGGEIADRSRLAVQTPQSLSALLGIEVRTLTEAVSIDRNRKVVVVRGVDDGKTEELPYDKLVLAPGASPLRPPLPGIDDPRIHTLRSLRDMDRIRNAAESARSVLIIGAGFIGIEMAEQFSRLGKDVTLVEMTGQVLPQLDSEMALPLENELRSHGITLVLDDGLDSFDSGRADAATPLVARLKSGREIASDLVILSIGVKPESRLAANAGLAIGGRGAIKVNEWMQTNDPDIYAAGDAVESVDRVTGSPMNLALGGPANRQGRVIASHIFQGAEKARLYPGHLGTAIVRAFDMSAGVTGWTEKRLAHAGIPYEATVVTDYQHASYYPGALPLTVKLLWSPADGHILGAQAFGVDGVDKRLDVLATALAARMTIDDLAGLELAYAPPFGSARDVVNTAGFVAQNQRDGLIRVVRELPADARVLDVRPQEVAKLIPLPGAINIPLNNLRKRIEELDKGTPWVTVCALGKTSYFAARILSENGFDVRSLAGGLKMRPASQAVEPPAPSASVSAPLPSVVSVGSEPAKLDCTGLSCPGPLLQLKARVDTLEPGRELHVTASDPGFAADVAAWCRSAGHELISVLREKGMVMARLRKQTTSVSARIASDATVPDCGPGNRRKGATVVVFSSEMDKVMAALVIANGAAALGGKVTLFFTFWGINALRREKTVTVSPAKGFLDRMFGWMLPRGLGKLPLSRMNFAGIGRRLMAYQMSSKKLPNLPALLGTARMAGIRLVACTMAMEAMGIRREELIEGIELGGVADYLESAERSGTNLFV